MVFEKYEGLRNDFLIVDERGAGPKPGLSTQMRRALCHRKAGVGADGVLTLLPPREPDALCRMHITNADGSVPKMCGNGLRCVVRYLADRGDLPEGEEARIDTDAGLYRVVASPEGVTVDLRGPSFDDPILGGTLKDEEVKAAGERFLATAVSVGNPHLVLHAAPDPELARRVGPLLETDPRFPERINVGFAQARGERVLDLVVWERGVGLTEACGTGACAAAAAFCAEGIFPFDEEVEVRLPGGSLFIVVSEGLDRITMRGPARRVFSGRARLSEVVLGASAAGARP